LKLQVTLIINKLTYATAFKTMPSATPRNLYTARCEIRFWCNCSCWQLLYTISSSFSTYVC